MPQRAAQSFEVGKSASMQADVDFQVHPHGLLPLLCQLFITGQTGFGVNQPLQLVLWPEAPGAGGMVPIEPRGRRDRHGFAEQDVGIGDGVGYLSEKRLVEQHQLAAASRRHDLLQQW